MQISNKNIREHRQIRTARLKSKIQTINKQNHHLQQHYFQFPLPQTFSPQHQTHNTFNFKTNHTHKTYTPIQSDSRKQLIKEKIKFRVKQELWNLLKKNFQKPVQNEPSLQPKQTLKKQNFDQQTGMTYLKGKAFSRTHRENAPKNSRIQQFSKNFDLGRSKTQQERLGESKGKEEKRRRVWSSVKMRPKDRDFIQKTQHKLSKSVYNLQKLQSFSIEPWRGQQEQNHYLM